MRMAAFILFSFVMMTSNVPFINGHPVGGNNLIEGKEFLSIYLNQGQTNNDRHQTYSDAKSQKLNRSAFSEAPVRENDEMKFVINNEDTSPENSNYYGYNGLTSRLDLRTTSDGLESTTKRISATEDDTDSGDSDKNVVKFITSGSKIVFLEDLPSEMENQTNEKLVDDHAVTRQSISDEIKVISVSVSSSKERSGSRISERINVTHAYDDADNVLVSDAKKSDFIIDDNESKAEDDSAKEGSMRVQRIVSPPRHISSDTDDSFAPIETVIINDEHYHKEGSAKPRSVSYSSLSQATNPILWDAENAPNYPPKNNRTTKQHVSELAPHYSSTDDIYNDPAKRYSEASKIFSVPAKFYSQPSKVYSEPAKVYGRPEKVYSVPAKVYSEPSRIYSEPAKVYSEPAKVYGEPSKIYGQPSKFYAGQDQSTTAKPKKIIFNLDKLPYDLLNAPTIDLLTSNRQSENRFNHLAMKMQRTSDITTEVPTKETTTTVDYSPTPEQNYEIDENVSVMTNGRQHGVQMPTNSPNATPTPSMSSQEDPDPKVGYVVEGRNFRKYRVEERTADGFIVGEYGVVSNDDGSLRGVRYTADSDINPNLIYEALMKFLSL